MNQASSIETSSPCLGVVVPVYNEEKTIRPLLGAVLAQPLVQEVIIVDDGSVDNTWALLQCMCKTDPRVKVIRHEQNQGKGAALRTGFSKISAPIAVVQDADLEYDPSEYSSLLRPILANKADVVFGSRFIGSEAHRVLYFWHSLGNTILTLFSNMATDLNLTDMETGYKVFRRELIQSIKIEENRFGFEPEIVAKISKIRGVRIYETAVSYHGRTYQEGKKIGWRDGIWALWCILKYNFFSHR